MPLRFLRTHRITRRDLRLGSGLVLFAYITAHLANHSLGLVSVSVAEVGLRVAVAFWHSLPGTVLLYTAAGVHLTLAMVAVYERRTLRMPAPEALRIAFGFGIPLLLIGHLTSTRFAFELYGLHSDYARIVGALSTSEYARCCSVRRCCCRCSPRSVSWRWAASSPFWGRIAPGSKRTFH